MKPPQNIRFVTRALDVLERAVLAPDLAGPARHLGNRESTSGAACAAFECEDLAPYGCWCDDACEDLGDCCADRSDVCQ